MTCVRRRRSIDVNPRSLARRAIVVSSKGVITAPPDETVPWTTGAFSLACEETSGLRWTGTRAELIVGPSAQLRALAEIRGKTGGDDELSHGYVAAGGMMTNREHVECNQATGG